MKYRIAFVVLSLLLTMGVFFGNAAKAQGFDKIDNHVRSLSINKNATKKDAALKITEKAETEIEKARAIYVWIALNIAYDTDFKVYGSDEAFLRRKGVCQGYSELFKEMCEFVGVEAITVSGASKWYNYEIGDRLGDHAWNIVNLKNGRRILLDATWGAGSVNGRTFNPKFSDYWFDASPELFVFSHLPKEEQYQLLSNPMDIETFKRLPGITPVLSLMGFDGAKLLQYFLDNKDAWFPLIYGYAAESGIKVGEMPMTGKLKKGNVYKFKFTSPPNGKMALINNGQFEFIDSDKETQYTPKETGRLSLAIKREGESSFNFVFNYEVK